MTAAEGRYYNSLDLSVIGTRSKITIQRVIEKTRRIARFPCNSTAVV